MSNATTATTTGAAAPRRRRMPKRAGNTILIVHLLAAGTWLGLDVAMAGLVFTALSTDAPETKAFAYQALEIIAVWPLITAGLVSLASGIVLGLGTTYGLIRYWWVAIKLAINVVLSTLTVFALRPGVLDLAEQGSRQAAGQVATFVEESMIFPPVVSTTALVVAFVLSVFKPFGRIGGRKAA